MLPISETMSQQVRQGESLFSTSGQAQARSENTPPSGGGKGDTVSISPEAQSLAEKSLAEGAASKEGEEASLREAPSDDSPALMPTGPDLVEGWKDGNYLRQLDNGSFRGSVSFTTQKGSAIAVSTIAENEQGSGKSLLVSVQDANGQLYQRRISAKPQEADPGSQDTVFTGVLRINETEEGISFTEDSRGTEGDDIIITMQGAEGLGGDDTILSLSSDNTDLWGDRSDRVIGGDGDDLLVDVSRNGTSVYGDYRAGHRYAEGDGGNDSIFIREITQGVAVQPGVGTNSLTVDKITTQGRLVLRPEFIQQGDRIFYHGDGNTFNTVNIDIVDGEVSTKFENNTLNINLLRGELYAIGASEKKVAIEFENNMTSGDTNILHTEFSFSTPAQGSTTVNINSARGAEIHLGGDSTLHVQKSYDSTYIVGGGASAVIGYGERNLALGSVNIRSGEDNFVTDDGNVFAYTRYYGLQHMLSLLEVFDWETINRSFIPNGNLQSIGQKLNEEV